ncbi:hypothetical protein [Stenoxybacter acetivorans]|uniref:hypothetical protein n=1 Tax=Stenoxybacter acetivorans TaxID=422441 RepID=UPI000564EB4D|nr:hypothetical protein [Stenoxybacter acetivorans]
MRQLIRFLPQDINENNIVKAQILLGDNYETFELYTGDWSKEDFVNQWKSAVRLSLKKRETTALFKNYKHDSISGIKILWLYTIIPEELAYPDKFIHADGVDFYITESFRFFTEKLEILADDASYNLINKNYGHYFPIYWLNIHKLERFYLYLSDRVEGISHWKVNKQDLKSILNYL